MFDITQRDVEHTADPIAILGAGLAGLSLADALLDRGCRTPIVLVDRRRRWENDRTWCTWLTGPLRFAELSRQRWWSWRAMRDGRLMEGRSVRHPYVHIEAGAVYERVLGRLRDAPTVALRSGERVVGLTVDGTRPVVRTSAGPLRAAFVVDALGAASPLGGAAESSLAIVQRFVGWEVETAVPAFDPASATLMDVRAAGPGGIDFLYELPFSPTRALLEHTTIGRHGPNAGARREALERECDRRAGPGRWSIVREEVGAIPMTPGRFPRDHGPRTLVIGGAAGAVRPSSGYAFTRIQRDVEVVADAVLAAVGGAPAGAGGSPAGVAPGVPAVGPARFAALDRAFLAALRDAPDGGAELFTRLIGSVDGDAFARFMTDVSTPADELSIMAALPARRMLGAGLRSLLTR